LLIVLAIGFVGAGVIAWAHAIGIQAMIRTGTVEADVVAVHDVDESRAIGFGAANGAAVVRSSEEVLERCDALWVCTPTAFHRQVVEAAVACGRPVFCEKPLAPNLADAEAMAAAVSDRGLSAQVGLVLRRTPVFRTLREVLDSGELGVPMTAVLRDDQYFPIQGMYDSTWRGDVATAGGGCLIEHSIHDVDILSFCMGDVVEVAARTANFAGHEGVEDLAIVSMQLESGVLAQVTSVWHGILSRGSTRRLEVFCEDGTAWLENDFSGPLHVQTGDEIETRRCPSPSWVEELPLAHDHVGSAIRMYVEADRAFLDAVCSGSAPEPSFHDGVVAHRIVDAAYRSAALGGTPVEMA
jgi:myo-inositol 2-dehydrogenase / D-chiro-inositol 1-dehydrogenase